MSSHPNYDESLVVGAKIHLKKAKLGEKMRLAADWDEQKIRGVVREFLAA